MSGDGSAQPPKRKPIVWNLKGEEAGKSGGSISARHRDTSPSVRRQDGAPRGTRSRSRSPRRLPENSAAVVTKIPADLRWHSGRSNGRREEYDHHHGDAQDLRRKDLPYRRRYDAYSDRDASAMRRGDRFRSRDDGQDGREPDLRARTSSRPGSNEGQVTGWRHPVAAAEKTLLEMSYEEYLAVFGQVQDAWRKRHLEMTFIKSQLSSGPSYLH